MCLRNRQTIKNYEEGGENGKRSLHFDGLKKRKLYTSSQVKMAEKLKERCSGSKLKDLS